MNRIAKIFQDLQDSILSILKNPANPVQRSYLLWLCVRILSIPVALYAFFSQADVVGLTSWRRLLAPWYAWDAYYYVAIVREGYKPGSPTANFHPLYPAISAVVSVVFREELLSLLLVASVAGLFLTVVFHRLARLDLDEVQSWQATALLLVSPFSLALFVPYTESLFLLLSVWCLLAARQGRLISAGLAGCLAVLTRQQGLFLVLPLAWEVWESADRNWSKALRNWSGWRAIALVPLAYLAWIFFRAFAINDLSPNFSSAQKFIYSVMISPTTYTILDQQQFLPPWAAIWKTLQLLSEGRVHWGAYVDTMLGLVFIGMFVLAWRSMRMSYRIYSLVIILVSLSFYTGTINPYISLPRHLLLAFPVFIGFASRYKLRFFPVLIAVLVAIQMTLLWWFVRQSWVL
jgi:Gpi18-like mannosyltransferase